MRLLSFVKKYIRPFWPHILFSLLCMGVVTALSLKMPDVFSQLMDRVFIENDRLMLRNVCFWIIGIFVSRGIFYWLQTYSMSYAAQRMVVNVRNDIYGHLQGLPLGFFERHRTGEIISALTNDINVVQNALSGGVLNIVAALALLGGAMTKMLLLNWRLTLLTLVVMPFMAVAVSLFANRIRLITASVQHKLADITALVQETVSGIRIVKAFSMEKHEIGRFKVENEKNFQFVMRGARAGATLTPVMDILFAGGAVIILWFGGLSVIDGQLSAGQLMAFILLLVLAANPLAMMGGYINSLSQSAAALGRLASLMQEKPELTDAPGAVDLPPVRGKVVFRRVGFSYDGIEPVLQDIDLEVDSGQMVALVGPSGGGKSTLVNLIPRFYGHYIGEILIDGSNIEDVRLQSLRKQIATVPQETILFGGSISDNISYGDPAASQQQVLDAAKAANAHDFIMEMPAGYDTEIGERGLKLSGGQRQRIAVARAILRNPRILILDEATSALDTHSERLVQEALETLMKGRTTFVIAHRLSTVRQADLIVVLDHGRIVERGTHEQLMEAGGLYSSLYRAQFREAGQE